MTRDQNRYFIELLPEGEPVPRNLEAEKRREQAAHFVAALHNWLHEKNLNDKVSAMAITALGQVQITCEADIISRIRHQEEPNIAAIRQGSSYIESLGKIGKL